LKQKGTEKIQGKSDGSRWWRDRFRPLCRPAHKDQSFLRGIIHFISVGYLEKVYKQRLFKKFNSFCVLCIETFGAVPR
jgi:hypothetical protein